jgi:hypothetical protein
MVAVIRANLYILEKINSCVPTGAGQIELIAKVGVPFVMCLTAFDEIPASITDLVAFTRIVHWPNLEILTSHSTNAIKRPSNSLSNMLPRAASESR